MALADDVKILVVNDNPGSLFALQTILMDLGVPIETAASGEEALMCLLKQDFAVIVLDVKMAGLDGFETARLIRQRPRSSSTPIIFLTSHRATDLDRSIGYELGAVDYLFMPVAPEVLKSKAKVFIDLARNSSQESGKEAELEFRNRALRQELEHVTRLNETLRAEVASLSQPGARGQGSDVERLILHRRTAR